MLSNALALCATAENCSLSLNGQGSLDWATPRAMKSSEWRDKDVKDTKGIGDVIIMPAGYRLAPRVEAGLGAQEQV